MSGAAGCLVVLNRKAHGGRAGARWEKVAGAVRGEVVEDGWHDAVGDAIARGVRVFIAAGGDGTVHAVLNAIVDLRGGAPLDEFALGAVGLGSSNDFHKPYGRVVAGIPCRLDAARAAPRDVGLVRYTAPGEAPRVRYFLVSAGMGTVAGGNALFNDGPRWLKSRWTGGAILWAALRAIAAHRPIEAALSVEGCPRRAAIASFSVMKSPYLSGSFRFPEPVPPADGLFAVKLLEGVGRARLLAALVNLAGGRAAGWRQWRAASVTVETAGAVPVEVDGELVRAARVEFSMLPERIRVCA